MKSNFFNPFRVIAGGKALAWGLLFIVSAIALLWCSGCVQNGYLHFGLLPDGGRLWQVAVLQIAYWLLPAILLYLCGLAMSKSKIRIIDMLGTTAFAQLLVIPMVAVMPFVDVSQITAIPLYVLTLLALWELAFLVVFLLWNYSAFTVSCNVSGAKAVAAFVVVQILLVIFAGQLSSWLL
ncbi:MAG: hypothetical protein ACI35T_00890 [Alistipes sp.]